LVESGARGIKIVEPAVLITSGIFFNSGIVDSVYRFADCKNSLYFQYLHRLHCSRVSIRNAEMDEMSKVVIWEIQAAFDCKFFHHEEHEHHEEKKRCPSWL